MFGNKDNSHPVQAFTTKDLEPKKLTARDIVMAVPSNKQESYTTYQSGNSITTGTRPTTTDLPLNEVIQAILDHIGLEIKVEIEKKLPQKTVITKKRAKKKA